MARKEFDVLDREALLTALGDEAKSLRICVYDAVDSTNNEAKRQAVAGETSPTLLVACEQTAGRGRLGRSFFSPNSGIYLSVLYPLRAPFDRAVSVTSAASVAVMRAIRGCTGIETDIKWVNDLYRDGKKVCGILAESIVGLSAQSMLVLGIGVNLRTREFPEELTSIAGTLEGTVTRAVLIAEIYRQLRPFLENPDDDSWLSDYRSRSCVIGKRIEWSDGEQRMRGKATGINERGELETVDDSGCPHVLRTGEISVRLYRE